VVDVIALWLETASTAGSNCLPEAIKLSVIRFGYMCKNMLQTS